MTVEEFGALYRQNLAVTLLSLASLSIPTSLCGGVSIASPVLHVAINERLFVLRVRLYTQFDLVGYQLGIEHLGHSDGVLLQEGV